MLKISWKTTISFFSILLISINLFALANIHSMKPLTIVKSNENLISLKVEIADNDEKRMRGLMFRKAMKADEGMLFIFDQNTLNPFWMKNTPLPLDIIFISAEKVIVAIAEKTVHFLKL